MKQNIVVLGSGFAAFSCLKKLDKDYYNVSIVSPRNHFLFTPLLASTTVGTIEFRSIIEPIRNLKHFNFYQSYCLSVDTRNKKVICEDSDTRIKFELTYDILVIAVGETTNTYNIEGVSEHAYFLRGVSDARRIRTKVIDCFENASLPGLTIEEQKQFLRFVVCGGGPTGVEFAAELYDFIEQDVKKKYHSLVGMTEVILTEVILIEALDKLLSSFDRKLSEYTMKIFKRQKIIVKTKSNVLKITDKLIYLDDGTQLNYGLLVWATGNTANDFTRSLSFPKTQRDKIVVDKFLKVKGYSDIYAVGDCAETEKEPYPSTAQVAQQEGKYLGKTLNRLAKHKNVKPFSFRNLGMLAYIGGHKALADTPQFKSTGFKTFIFWRSVYITKLVSLKNKILVLFDWFKTFVFGRDVSNF